MPITVHETHVCIRIRELTGECDAIHKSKMMSDIHTENNLVSIHGDDDVGSDEDDDGYDNDTLFVDNEEVYKYGRGWVRKNTATNDEGGPDNDDGVNMVDEDSQWLCTTTPKDSPLSQTNATVETYFRNSLVDISNDIIKDTYSSGKSPSINNEPKEKDIDTADTCEGQSEHLAPSQVNGPTSSPTSNNICDNASLGIIDNLE
nr:hypothetical protein [Tanacetum cinerariifolium]